MGVARLRTGARLFVTYAVASLVPVVVLGAVLTLDQRTSGVERGLSSARAQAAVIQEMAISPALSGDDLREGLSGSEQRQLQHATDLAIFRGSVLRLRLRDFDGGVVFSDDGRVRDLVPASDPAFVDASLGRATATVTQGSDGGSQITVLQPLTASSAGRAVGVLELTLPYDAVAAEVKVTTTRTVQRLGAGLGLLYVVLGLISFSTTRRLRVSAARATYESLHDPLTGIANRELFRRELAGVRAAGEPAAVVLVDLDKFKQVNDNLGHHAGDELLKAVAQRLTDATRTDDVVARLGGDEFGLLLRGVATAELAMQMLVRVHRTLCRDVLLDGRPVAVEASIGVALHPGDGLDDESLLKAADAAMYHSKRTRQPIVMHDPELTHARSLIGLEDVRRALEDDSMVLLYQPVVELATGRTNRLEALVRLQHEQHGLVMPDEFVPEVEGSPLIGALSRWVLGRALADCAAWSRAGQDWDVSVNISATNLDDAFPGLVAAALREHGLRPERLVVEITETALVERSAVDVLEQLVQIGVRISLDDIGTGYAGLSQLIELPLHEVKIDRGFVTDLRTDRARAAVVRSLVAVAETLGIDVVAEGVEDHATADHLRDLGCALAQGYVFSRPCTWASLAPPARRDESEPTAVDDPAPSADPQMKVLS